jgi:telomere length regulation protein
MLLLLMAHTNTSRLREISSSSIYNESLSNRLSASVDRVRFLGMIVGESISRKIDPEERRLKFKVTETEDATAEAWRSLIDIDDEIYPLKDLRGGIVEEAEDIPVAEPPLIPAEEVTVDEIDDLDDDLPTYPAPESDAEDSDDDPTLVSREKTPNPLYFTQRFVLIVGIFAT